MVAARMESMQCMRTGIVGDLEMQPLAYFITFHTYGTWLHGSDRGSVDRTHNVPGTEFVPPDEERERAEFRHLKHEPVYLDGKRRDVVNQTVLDVCRHRNGRSML
jgi:hypothetical protein